MKTAKTLALACALLALVNNGGRAHVAKDSTSHVSRNRGNFGPELLHRSYIVPDSLETTNPSFNALTSPNNELSAREIAIQFVKENHPHSDFIIKNIYKSEHNGITHIYIKQIVNGLQVANSDLNVNIDKFGRIISYGDSFVVPHSLTGHQTIKKDSFEEDNVVINNGKYFITSNSRQVIISSLPPNVNNKKLKFNTFQYKINHDAREILTPYEVIKSFASYINKSIPSSEELHYLESFNEDDQDHLIIENIPFALSPVKLSQRYLQLDDMSLQLVWDLQIELENNWYHAHINAHTGELMALIDWVADATYNVFPLGLNDPSEGDRELLVDPHDIIASPSGWHNQGKRNFTTTIGNNVFAHENLQGKWEWENNYRPDGGESLIFGFPLDLSGSPKSYIDTSITNLFYWNNLIHDLFYRYGFDEVAGNFQQYNNGKGGKDKDPVIANAQDGSGFNNANFATPPDGQHGKMRMYVWDVVNPWRDGDLEAGIIIHEYSHGISTRLTGGPANSGCLGWGEAGGMGEGWGDFFATILRMKPDFNRSIEFGMGNWANGGKGIRKYPYSTSLKTNPETFAVMDRPGYWGVHAKGAVWAEMLYEVYWNLVDKHGFTSQWFPPTTNDSDSSWYKFKSSDALRCPKHGNTLALQLVVDGMKLQPCHPTFIDARNAIIQADEFLTNGENKCEIWKGFAKRGLGIKAKIIGNSPWGGGIRSENFHVPKDCKSDKDDSYYDNYDYDDDDF